MIIKQVKDGGSFFGIGANEKTATSNWEQLGLVVQYLSNGKPLERLVEYTECGSCSGEAIGNHIVQALINRGWTLKCVEPRLMMKLVTWQDARIVVPSQRQILIVSQSVSLSL